MVKLPGGLILDDMWVPMRLRLEGRSILFAEDAVCLDDAFDDSREYGRKVRTLAGNYQLFSLLPGLLTPFRNPSWPVGTASHKGLRLAGPWALVGLLGSTAVLSFSPRRGRSASPRRPGVARGAGRVLRTWCDGGDASGDGGPIVYGHEQRGRSGALPVPRGPPEGDLVIRRLALQQ